MAVLGLKSRAQNPAGDGVPQPDENGGPIRPVEIFQKGTSELRLKRSANPENGPVRRGE
jgi:hypothetical protein